MGANLTAETLELMKVAQSSPDPLIKSFVQPGSATTGVQAYNLEAPSKKLFPVDTPLRNSIARVPGGYAIQANWKAITNINVQNVRAGVSEGNRGGVINHALTENFAAFRGFGLENSVNFEANYASKNFEDVKALAVEQSLAALMVQEERLILGGNTSVAMGQTATPSATGLTTGGAIPGGTYSLIAVALGLQAYIDVVGVNNGSSGQYFSAATASVPGQITRTNAGGSTDSFGGGSAQPSNAQSVTVGATSAGSISATVVATNGAVGYAWYLGASGAEKLVAVTSVNSATLTALPAPTAQLASSLGAADHSTSALDFDGLLYQAFKPGSNAYINTLPTGNGGLTADGAGGIADFELAFVNFYNKFRLSPTVVYVSSQELVNITKKIVANGGAPLLRLTTGAENPGTISAGLVVGEYLNKVTGTKVALRVHPNMPAGTVLFYTEKLPYPLSNVSNVTQMLMRQDYYQLEWPLVSRKYEYGVYADGVLQCYAPFSLGVINNIANI